MRLYLYLGIGALCLLLLAGAKLSWDSWMQAKEDLALAKQTISEQAKQIEEVQRELTLVTLLSGKRKEVENEIEKAALQKLDAISSFRQDADTRDWYFVVPPQRVRDATGNSKKGASLHSAPTVPSGDRGAGDNSAGERGLAGTHSKAGEVAGAVQR